VTRIGTLQARGIHRRGSAKAGFRYVNADGRHVSRTDRARIARLRIPPAWRDVAISPSSGAVLQAVGRDAAGRWQYLYHPAHTSRQERKKYARLLAFACALPKMRQTVALDLARPGFPQEKVLACGLRILSTCFVRPGSARYAKENGSFGLATLRRRHIAIKGDVVTFSFPGKAGKHQNRELRDRRVARILRGLLQTPGEVLKYRDDEGMWRDVRRRHINEYLKRVMGDQFSAKDFRTWSATLIFACALARAGTDASESLTSRRRKTATAVRETAEKLGNTPAVCRGSYIAPAVVTCFERGLVMSPRFGSSHGFLGNGSRGLNAAEAGLVRLLRRGRGRS
jgi:DNA topoisomerase I